MRGWGFLLFVLLWAGLLAASWAPAASAQTLGAKMEAQATPAWHANYAVAQRRMTNGTAVRTYVTPAGVVFGVAWQGPRVPDLKPLLGARFGDFQQAARQPSRRRGPLYVKVDSLVVENSGHMRAFHGRAYLTDALPAGVSAAVIQ